MPGVAENYRYWGEEDTVFVKTVQGAASPIVTKVYWTSDWDMVPSS